MKMRLINKLSAGPPAVPGRAGAHRGFLPFLSALCTGALVHTGALRRLTGLGNHFQPVFLRLLHPS